MDINSHIQASWKQALNYVVPLIFLTLVQIGISILTLGVLAPATFAGYTDSLLRLRREGRTPKIEDVFSQMRLFLPLLFFTICWTVLTAIGYMLLVVPGIAVSLFLLFSCLYVVPLMVDKKMGLVEAVRTSWELSLKGVLVDQFLVVVIVAGLLAIGGSMVIASLFTQPLAVLFTLSVYEEKAGALSLRT